ncbi:RNA polymerase sigma factor [Breznakia pachnodae]|uniref:RNA polymerase sigma factor (Sigma-70 family) n=1 Tax=Breznakia pachnodae TaxID=265178 RepID=A0ABU0E2I8_9FIRM|nr:RNA polymerase sigma factor [Breznakia pachnodae]MDQ0360936.1 RNA polymerase sigma factor (sigma-70 family) [Breznakia pachnodae]
MDKREELTQIVETVQKDRGQFELLYSQIVKKVYFWCYSVIGNESDALDASQEAILRIYNKLHTLKNPEGFTSWMYILVRNICYRYLDNKKRKEYEFFDDHEFSGKLEENIIEYRREALPNEIYNLNETKRIVGEFIEKLPKKQKEVIILYYLEELSIGEVAKILDQRVGTIKSRLHTGRKQIEDQVNEYEEKNNTKLYSLALLPLLGLFLREYRDEVCARQDLRYDKNFHDQIKGSRFSRIINIITNNLYVIIVIIVIVGLLSMFVSNQSEDAVIKSLNIDYLLSDDLEMFNKANSNPYIESISYLTFPTRNSLEVTIKLKKEVDQKDIQILSDNHRLFFEKDGNTIVMNITANGRYSIVINGKMVGFEITSIDEYAPELIDVIYNEDSLQLVINDEMGQIDYEKSYIENNGKIYKIDESLRIYGSFKGYTRIIIFNHEELHIDYVIDF